MKKLKPIKFSSLFSESRDGEWGSGAREIGHTLCEVIRGTDFSSINEAAPQFPKRWIKDHLVERKKLQPGDILLETAGGTAKQSTGRSALLTKEFFDQHSENPVLCASFSRYLRLKPEYFPEYIFFLLQALYNSGFMAVYNLQHTGVSRFQFTTFKNRTELQIPPKDIQQKIAAILSAYDDLIENNKRRIALLEKIAEEIYREWFVRFHFPGYQAEKFEKGIPKEWYVVKLGNISKIEKGISYKGEYLSDTGAILVNLKCFSPGGGYRLDGEKFYSGPYGNTHKVKEGDLILANTDLTQDGGIIGNPELIPVGFHESELIISHHLCVIRLREMEKYKNFMFHTLKTGAFKGYAKGFANGATVLGLRKEEIDRYQFILPPKELLEKFCGKVDPIYKNINMLRLANNYLEKMKKMLLPRLISGNLSVENLDIKFPPGMQEDRAA